MTEVDPVSTAILFLDARSHSAWAPRAVDDATLRRIYEVSRMAPTSANSQPMRVLFVKSHDAKEKLRPALAAGNVEKTMAAPVTAIIAVDPTFHEKMPKLFPARPQMAASLASMPPEARQFMLLQNGSLQAGYFIIAARSLGLDCGPMGGFDRAKVNETLLADLGWQSILLINLGYGLPERLMPRNPRLDFDEACKIV